MKNNLFTLSLLLLAFTLGAQTPGGKMFFSDIDRFNSPGPGQGLPQHFNCGDDASLELSTGLTMEAWFRSTVPSDNQKIMGKVTSSFNNGYMLGIANSRLNPEVWTPNNNTFQEGFIAPIITWRHYAVTFEVGGMYRGYLDGEMIYEVSAGSSNINSAVTNFIIGVSPWGNNDAFAAFGEMDEMRLWNIARTPEEIQDGMFRELGGNETGLVLYQNFNNESGGMSVPDLSSAGNDCMKVNLDPDNFPESTCIIANTNTLAYQGLRGLWFASSPFFQDPRTSATDQGMYFSANFIGQDSGAYVVVGHNVETGISIDDLPANAPAAAARTARVWSLTIEGAINPNVHFDLDGAAGGGTVLDLTQPANHYTLLERSGTTGLFSAVAQATAINGSLVEFGAFPVQENTEYTIAVGTAPFITGVNQPLQNAQVLISPNPGKGEFTLDIQFGNPQNGLLEVFDGKGSLLRSELINNTLKVRKSLDLTEFSNGLYFVKVSTDQGVLTKKLILSK